MIQDFLCAGMNPGQQHDHGNGSLDEGHASSSTQTIAFCDRMQLLGETNRMSISGAAAKATRWPAANGLRSIVAIAVTSTGVHGSTRGPVSASEVAFSCSSTFVRVHRAHHWRESCRVLH